MSCFLLHFNLDYCLCKHYPVENVYLYCERHFPLVPIQKSCALWDNCLVYSTSLVPNNYLGLNKCSVHNHFHFSSECLVSYCSFQFRLLSLWNIIQLRMFIFTVNVIFPFDPLQKCCAMRDNCLVYITSLVSKNYLCSNNCSVENNFHLLVKVLFPSALLFRLLSVLNIIQFRMYIFTLNVIFPFDPLQKCCAMRDNCLVYITSLVSNNYLGSNKCSVENNFHLLVKVLFPSALLFKLLSVWNIIQFRMSIFTLHVIFPFVPIQKSCALWDNCLVYSTSLVSNNYLGLNKCYVDNHFHFSSESFVSICSSV